MALMKPDGTYITVEACTLNKVIIRIHKDTKHRQRYKNQTESQFETTFQEDRNVEVDFKQMADPEKSIIENVITAGYKAIKGNEEFKDSSDC